MPRAHNKEKPDKSIIKAKKNKPGKLVTFNWCPCFFFLSYNKSGNRGRLEKMERGGDYLQKGGEKGEIQPHPGTSGRVRHPSETRRPELLCCVHGGVLGSLEPVGVKT